MTFRQIIRPGDTDDVPPHEHDATEISGVFNFFRALKGVITGDLTISGFIRTAKTGQRIEIRPIGTESGLVPSLAFHTGADFAESEPFVEVLDQGGGVWALLLTGPVATAGVVSALRMRSDSNIQVLGQFLMEDGTATAPTLSYSASGQQDVGFYRAGADLLGGAVAGLNADTLGADGWTNVARGQLGYAEVIANQTGITTEADLTGLSVTVTTPADRRIKITGRGFFAAAAASIVELKIKESTTQLQQANIQDPSTNAESLEVISVITPTAASHTYKLTLTGSSSTDLVASATLPAFLLVEDIGPA